MRSGLFHHFLLTLRLNFRSKQAVVYGFLVPILFLLAFGGIFQSDTPLLLHQMGQLLAISILGGACFGLPTAFVAERERGVWRRYRLLPTPAGGLIASTLAARLVLVAAAAAGQLLLARAIYGTPLPLHPVQIGAAFLVVTASFLGLGLLIAALADDVPAVQALGQCLFLPMIMIGGMGVPLAALPAWAQLVSGFMPGRYAVDVLQRCVSDPDGLHNTGFSLGALGVIGAAAGVVGARLFRWDNSRRPDPLSRIWAAVALLAWIAVGCCAAATGRLRPLPATDDGFNAMTPAQIADISFRDLPEDGGIVTPIAPPFRNAADRQDIADFAERLGAWAPGRDGDTGQAVRNLVAVAAIADLSEDPREGRIGRAVLDLLRTRWQTDELGRALAWIVYYPNRGSAPAGAPELGLPLHPPPEAIRNRSVWYAEKYLGRILGKIRD